MVGAGSAKGKGDPISTTTTGAKCTRIKSGHTFQPTSKKSIRRSGLTNGERDKLVELVKWDRATVAIGGLGELTMLSSR